jgi:hypothetical protein
MFNRQLTRQDNIRNCEIVGYQSVNSQIGRSFGLAADIPMAS